MTYKIVIPPKDKILLDALAALLQLPEATVVARALVVYRDSLGPDDQAALEAFCRRVMQNREALLLEGARQTTANGQPKAIYEFTRLCFKRDVIEPLAPNDQFRVITPGGVFQMSKADFYRVFPNVIARDSYTKKGLYHYPRLPAKAERFRVHADQ